MDQRTEIAAIRAAQAEPRCFGVLYDAHFIPVFRFIHRRTGDSELAADLSQQTFLKAMLALPRYRTEGSPFRAWLYRIALNELRMHWRRRKEVVMDLGWAEVKGLADECGLHQLEEDMRKLSTALSQLTGAQAHLVELRYFDGLSFAELGRVLGIGEDAAKMRTHRVLGLLRNQLTRKA